MNNLNCLTSLPSTDGNFLSALKIATKEELVLAINNMRTDGGSHKSRILSCERELKKRENICSYIQKEEYESISQFRDKLGEQFFDFFMEEDNNTKEIGRSIVNAFLSCKTKAEIKAADRMLTATCGYSFGTIIEEIKKKDLEHYCWESIW